MTGRTHIVGAGVAGLAAALAVTRRGGAVTLYEAAPQAGGRCRTVAGADGSTGKMSASTWQYSIVLPLTRLVMTEAD